jgi:hypothetical protein
MRNSVLVLLLIIFPVCCLQAQDSRKPLDDETDELDTLGTVIQSQIEAIPTTFPISIGEQVVFHVAFGIIPAGKATLAVVDTATIENHLCYHIISTARSAKAFDYVFKVRDSVESWMDADSIYSHRFHKLLMEGKYRDEKLVVFDHAESLAHWWDKGKPKPPIPVEPRIQDVLTAGFKVREADLRVGDTLRIRTHDVNKTYDVLVIVHGRETVETPAGRFECFKVEPILRSGGIFKKEKGARIFVWLTADDRRIPVMMKSKVSFGSVTAVMESYKPGKPIKL